MGTSKDFPKIILRGASMLDELGSLYRNLNVLETEMDLYLHITTCDSYCEADQKWAMSQYKIARYKRENVMYQINLLKGCI